MVCFELLLNRLSNILIKLFTTNYYLFYIFYSIFVELLVRNFLETPLPFLNVCKINITFTYNLLLARIFWYLKIRNNNYYTYFASLVVGFSWHFIQSSSHISKHSRFVYLKFFAPPCEFG
jgi:hypothetical protein